jgi:hypothetical protein
MSELDQLSHHVAASTGGAHRRQALELARQLGRMYVGLRGHVADPSLFSYIPPELALREHILPLVLEGSTLRVAVSSAEPDLSLVRVHYPQLQLEYVCAPATEIAVVLDRVLGR